MKTRSFKQKVVIPAPVDQVFEFFSSAENLEKITPPFLKFRITSPLPVHMKQGAIIEYRLRVHGLPIFWRTHIKEWKPMESFIDEQQKGPYRKWIHQHTFSPSEDGRSTINEDKVEYAVWGDFLMHGFIRKDVESIFAYRTKKIESIFGDSRIPNELQNVN